MGYLIKHGCAQPLCQIAPRQLFVIEYTNQFMDLGQILTGLYLIKGMVMIYAHIYSYY